MPVKVSQQQAWAPSQACSTFASGHSSPQVTFLWTLVRALPHACFILNVRPVDHWLASARDFIVKDGLASRALGTRTVGELYQR